MNDPDPGQDRGERAAARRAEAAAKKAESDADKAASDADKAAADAEKAKADARAAEATARKAEQEAADHDSPAAASARDAEARKKAAEADKDAATARRAQIAALIPDLSTVKDSTLEVKEGPPAWGTLLLSRALQDASAAVAARLDAFTESGRILVTSDPDLASGDAVYQDVTTGLSELITAATDLLTKTAPPETPKIESADDLRTETAPSDAPKIESFTPIDVVGAIAGAIPAVLSLLSAHRTLSTSSVTPSDLVAAAGVAGALVEKVAGTKPDLIVVHDDFRLIPGGGVYTQAGEVAAKRQALVSRKIELDDASAEVGAKITAAEAEVTSLQKAKPPPSDLAKQLADLVTKLSAHKWQLAETKTRASLVDALIAAVDTFTAAIRVVPTGARRSALAAAALHEQLHQGTPMFTHVLLVKTQPGTARELISNRPLWWKDTFSAAVDAGITYVLIRTSDSAIIASGTETALKAAHGDIGGSPTIEDR